MTLLSLVQQACGEIGIGQPTQIIGSADSQVMQLLALANREGREFSHSDKRSQGWQNLHKDYTFLTVGGITVTGNVTNGSTVITGITSTAGISPMTWAVSGNGLANTAFVASVDSASQITINLPATLTATGVTLVFGQVAYPLPNDFDHFITGTLWDGSYRWQLLGPLEAQEKNVIKYGISPVGPRRRFWIESNLFWLNPTPTNNTDVIAYDYYSNSFCTSTAGVAQSSWMADTDNYSLDNDCFVLGLIWRFRAAKGLSYGQERQNYDMAAQRAMARDGGSRDLAINTRSQRLHLLSDTNIPDTGYGK